MLKVGGTFGVIDIGSSKVCCMIVHLRSDDSFDVLGVGYCACRGVRAGVIVSMNDVCSSLAKAVELAELSAKMRIECVVVNISGIYFSSRFVSNAVDMHGRVVTQGDVHRLLYKNILADSGDDVLHNIPILFSLDGVHGIHDPVGMVCQRLSVEMHIMSYPRSQLNNILVCLSRCHLEVAAIVSSSYAVSLACVDSDDGNLIVIDFGAETTTICYVYKGIFCGSYVFDRGGSYLTERIVQSLNVSWIDAERIKTLYACAHVSLEDEYDFFLAPVIDYNQDTHLKQVSKAFLNSIARDFARALVDDIGEQIESSVFREDFCEHIVVTGGGMSLPGLTSLLSERTKKVIHIKNIFLSSGAVESSGVHAVCVGMARFVCRNIHHIPSKLHRVGVRFFCKLLSWFGVGQKYLSG